MLGRLQIPRLLPAGGRNGRDPERARREGAGGGRRDPDPGTRLRRLERAGSSADPTIRLALEPDGGRTVEARHVVLALPKRPILSLDRRSLPFSSPSFASDIDAVSAVPASKLLLAYRENWWGKLGLTSGRSLTDLPIHQCIYFGTERRNSQTPLLTATYNDAEDVAYFERFPRYEESFESQGELPDDLVTPRAMVLAVQSQLAKLHGSRVPAPYWAAFKDWAATPIGAGWHFWKVGRRSWEVMPRIRKPVADANLYVCGEAWSTSQGWVEGSLLNTSERVLHGPPRPAPPALARATRAARPLVRNVPRRVRARRSMFKPSCCRRPPMHSYTQAATNALLFRSAINGCCGGEHDASEQERHRSRCAKRTRFKRRIERALLLFAPKG